MTLGGRRVCTLDLVSGIERHRVAVIRVELREPPANGLLIEVLEVGRDRVTDRPLGSATSAPELCTIIEDWLSQIWKPRGS